MAQRDPQYAEMAKKYSRAAVTGESKVAPPIEDVLKPDEPSAQVTVGQLPDHVKVLLDQKEPMKARIGAAKSIAALKQEAAAAAPALVAAIAEEDEQLQYYSFRALTAIGRASIPSLGEGVRTAKSPAHRFRVCKALISFHESAFPEILSLLNDPDKDIRYIATEAAGRISPPMKDAMPILLERLGDPHIETARAAARGLAPLRPLSVPGLEEKMKDPSEQVRAMAEMALKLIEEKNKISSKNQVNPPDSTPRPFGALPGSASPGGAPAVPPVPVSKPVSASPTPRPAQRNDAKAVAAVSEVVTPESVRPEATSRSAATSEPFVDASPAMGLRFMHERGAQEKKHMPETVGAGAAWLDFDQDGFLDLYLSQGGNTLDGVLDGAPSSAEGHGHVLLRNVAGKSFEDVTVKAGLGHRGYGMGTAVGDFDNDGWADLYVTNFGPNALYRNQRDGTFRDVTVQAGVAGGGWSTSVAWADFDLDGFLDLYVARYVEYDPKTAPPCTTLLPGPTRKVVTHYCYPQNFGGVPDLLFHNERGEKFVEVGAKGPVGAASGRNDGKSLGVLASDFDGDGDPDVFVANDTTPNHLWRNEGGLKFSDVGLEMGFALSESGSPRAGMGIDRGDVDRDGRIDYTVTNFTRESNTLYLNRQSFFADGTRTTGLAEPSFLPLGFGVRFTDYDMDGDLDIYVANGHVIDYAAEIEGPTSAGFEQAADLYQNDGTGKFREIASESGAWFQRKYVGRSVAEADFDNDGDGDLLIVNNGGPAILLENRAGTGKRWIGVELRMGEGGDRRTVLGSRVEVLAGQARWVKEYVTDGSYLAAHDPRIRVGLGSSEGPVTVRVRWSGARDLREYGPFEPGRYHVIRRDLASGK